MFLGEVNEVWLSFYLARATMNKHIRILETFKNKGKVGPAKVYNSWVIVEHSGHLKYWHHGVGISLIDNGDTSILI